MSARKCINIAILLVAIGSLTACSVPLFLIPIDWMPEGGVWYCEELQLQLSFEKDVESYILVDGEQKKCAIEYQQYSNELFVYCFQDGNEWIDEAEMVFFGKRVRLDDEEFVLETKDEERFVFERVA